MKTMKAAVVAALGAPLEIRSSPVTKASASSSGSAPERPCVRSATGSRSPGSDPPAGAAGTACRVARPCCEAQTNSGYSVDGTYAEYALADERFAVPVPEAVSSFDAAPLSCAGVTTFKAIKVAGVAPGERVGVAP